jgi:hypothetical protein
MQQACYRELRNYKYQLTADYVIDIDLRPPHDIEYELFTLSVAGRLTIRKGYAWDGPSGPTIDTRNFMRASLVHDALYQLMRLGALNADATRERADRILRDICRQDGMSNFRAWYAYQALRMFGAKNARANGETEMEIVCVP